MMVFALGMFPLLMLAVSLVRTAGSAHESHGFKATVFGLLSGIIVCAIKALFVFSSADIVSDFFARFWYVYGEVAIPFIVLAVVFFPLFKGESRAKIASFFFLFSAYWTILLPYHIISGPAPDFFEFCVAPLLYAAATADTSLLAARFYDALEGKRIPALAACAIGCLLVFAFIGAAEASRDTGGSAYTAIASIFSVYSAGILAFCRGKKTRR
jgi:hypothetical protein